MYEVCKKMWEWEISKSKKREGNKTRKEIGKKQEKHDYDNYMYPEDG